MITLEVVTSENAIVFKGVRLRALQDTPSASAPPTPMNLN